MPGTAAWRELSPCSGTSVPPGKLDTIRSFCRRHNCRDAELIEQRIQNIRQAIPAIRDAVVIEPAVTMTRSLLELIATLREGLAKLEQQIAEATASHPDFPDFDSFPGPGDRAATIGGLWFDA